MAMRMIKKTINVSVGLMLFFSTAVVWALTPTEVAKLLASDGAADDHFGVSVSLDGDTALIGVMRDFFLDDSLGSAYVFVRDTNGNWTERAKLTASDGAALDYFGSSVSLDGNTALIGAEYNDGSGTNGGSAYVFVRDTNGNWTERAKLTASDGSAGDEFGSEVSVDGDTALIGTPDDDDNAEHSGSAYVFVRDTNGNWTERAKLTVYMGISLD